MFRILTGALAVALIGAASFALAQHNHGGQMMHHGAPPSDAREFVRFPEPLVEHTLANMRDHLAALQEIQDHLGMGHTDIAAQIAERRLGMSSLELHGAHEVAKFMPKGMQDAGTAMHRAASQFATVATDAGVSGDMKPVFKGLANLTATCVGCHATYRIK